MTINISGQVPGEAQNGMVDLEEDWLGDRTPDTLVAVVLIQRAGFKFDDDKQERHATMKFLHIEPLLDGVQAQAGRDLLERACARRGGSIATPDMELDIPEEREVDLDTPLAEGDIDNVGDPFEPEPESAPTLRVVE